MYAKIFSQIFDSSLAENYKVRHVFMDLLVLADRDGVVDMTPQAIARRTKMPLRHLMSALSALEQPDPQSRSDLNAGRRIIRLDDHREWGWQITNFRAYHEIRDEDARREQNRSNQQKHREKERKNKHLSAPVSTCQQRQPPSAHVDVDVDVDTDTDLKETDPPPKKPAGGRAKLPNPFSDAYKTAFDANHEQHYEWQKGDFAQLTKWRKAYPAVTPEQFVEVAKIHWDRGQYTPGTSLTIRGLCSEWSKLAAYKDRKDGANATGKPTDYSKGF